MTKYFIAAYVSACNYLIIKHMVYTRSNYFSDKEQKQLQRDEKNKGIKSHIFQNCIIYVNGYTKPWNRLKLHKEIISHGGQFKHYLTKLSGVTHIIASNLPLQKRIQFQKYKVVKPDWIVDSIENNKLLPWQDYSLLSNSDETQRKLLISNSNLTAASPDQNIDCNDPSFISNYLSNSRLHLLSDWKSQLRSNFLSNNRHRHVSPNDEFIYLHIDFDSFFATVAYLYRPPHFLSCQFDKDPVVVCHGHGNSDIASCNYVARKYGIRNGIWVSHASSLLPSGTKLITLPYDFNAFKLTSQILFDTLNNDFPCFNHQVIPISIDECIALLPRSPMYYSDALHKLCQDIRDRVFELTQGCTVSIGVGHSQVQARLALKLAKPNGIYMVLNDFDFDDIFLSNLEVSDLPGLGPSMLNILHSLDPTIKTLSQLSEKFPTLDPLKRIFGNKLGMKVFLTLQGKDDEETRRLVYDTENVFAKKTISLEINWGIRFQTIKQIDQFLRRASLHLIETKLTPYKYYTSSITLKILRRSKNAPIDPPKYLGCGKCDSFSQSSNLGVPSDDPGVICTELQNLFRILACPPLELRGVGIHFQVAIKNSGNNVPNKLGIDVLLQKENISKRIQTPSPIITAGEAEVQLPLLMPPNIPSIRLRPVHANKSKQKRRQISPLKNSRIYKVTNFGPNNVVDDIPSTFQIDFLKELPTQIRNEINRERRIYSKAKKTEAETLKRNIAKRKVEKSKKTSHFMGRVSIFEPIKFQNMDSFQSICNMIVQWIRETITDSTGPHEKDVKLFKRYLIKLYNTNRVHLVLRVANIISTELNLCSTRIINDTTITQSGLQQWDNILFNVVIPILHQNYLTFQSERNINIEYNV